MRLPADILSTWHYCAEVPELWIPLLRGRELPQGAPLAAALLRWRARPAAPVSILHHLLEEGEFAAAIALLTHPGFCTRVSPEEMPALQQEISKRRAAASRRFAMKAELERLRAQRLQVSGMEQQLRHAARIAEESIPEALAALAKISEELESHETTEALEISRTLGLAQHDGGPSRSAPRRPAWLYPHPPLEVCRWFQATREQSAVAGTSVPRGFFSQWTPIQGESGWLMLDAMEVLLQTPVQLLTHEMAVQFAAALATFLGVPQQTEPEVRPLPPAGFLVHLPTVCDESCPPISPARFPTGVPLLLGDGSAGRLPDAPFTLHFSVRPPGGGEPAGVIYLEPALLFRLLGDPHRRQTFLREIGARIPPVHGVSAPSPTAILGAPSFSVVQRYLLSCLDYLGMRCHPSHLVDQIVYYSGGQQALLDALLYGIMKALGGTRGPISTAHLEAAWNEEDFRASAELLLLTPLDGQPRLQSTLDGLARFCEGDLGDISAADLKEWLDEAGIEMGVEELEQLLGQLCERGLVEQTENGGYDLVRSGISQLTISLLQARLGKPAAEPSIEG